jgi:hypothetical protein
MDTQGMKDQLVHSYDIEQRAIRCGIRTPSSSTKHDQRVTCPECRRILDEAAREKAESN